MASRTRSQTQPLMKYCPHCDKHVSKTTFFAHKRLYFNLSSRKWSKSRVNYARSTDEALMYDLDQDVGLDVPGFSIETDGERERSSSPGSDRSPGLEFDQTSDVQVSEHDGGTCTCCLLSCFLSFFIPFSLSPSHVSSCMRRCLYANVHNHFHCIHF